MMELERRSLLGVVGGVLAAGVAPGEATAAVAPGVDYRLQEDVTGLSVPKAVACIGTGGFGVWPALIAGLSGVQEMLLVDAGDVDALDLARAPFRPADVGRPKAEALADVLRMLRPSLSIRTMKRFVNPGDEYALFGQVVFDGTNSTDLGKYLAAEASKRKIRYVQGFYNGLQVGTADHYVEELRLKRGDPVPVWVGAAALSGTLAVHSAFAKPINFFGDPGTLSVARKDLPALLKVDYADK